MNAPQPLYRRCAAEALGSANLLAVVVGSGIMGERLAQGNAGIALLANSLATGAGLFVLISLLGPVSGAHFNPVVSLVEAWRRRLHPRELPVYLLAQICGALLGVILAHLMFDLQPVEFSSRQRHGSGQYLSEIIATAGLVLTIVLATRQKSAAVPALVATYIVAAYWFTASTSFANPAVTLARALTPTFAGIAPADVPAFVLAQLLGACLGMLACVLLLGREQPAAAG